VASVALSVALPACAQEPEESLRAYAVYIVKTPPLRPPVTGYGIYLGGNAVISAAHVVGRWPLFTRPRVIVGDLDLPATVIKMGFADNVDLTLLTVDEARLPLSMRMRRNPICKTPPVPGEKAFGVIPDKVVPTQILSPLSVSPVYRQEYNTLTTEVVTGSGSGIFRASTKCLLGIMSRSVPRLIISRSDDDAPAELPQAGYFIPAAKILEFLPKEFHF
jgi:hypothetical protein